MTEPATYDDWTPELQRFHHLSQRTTDYNTAGMLAIAAELAALRKVLTPTETVELRPTGQLGRYVEAIEARLSELRTDESVPADLMPQEPGTNDFALHRMMREEDRTHLDLMAITGRGATIKQVGWYCPGGHRVPDHLEQNGADDIAVASVRLQDPCGYAVPMYVLVKP